MGRDVGAKRRQGGVRQPFPTRSLRDHPPHFGGGGDRIRILTHPPAPPPARTPAPPPASGNPAPPPVLRRLHPRHPPPPRAPAAPASPPAAHRCRIWPALGP